MSLETLHRLEAPYIGGVYHFTPFVVLYPWEETEGGDSTTASGSPLALGVSRQRRRILVEKVDEEEEKELTRPHPQG